MKTNNDELQYAVKQLREKGYGVIHPSQFHPDMEDEFLKIWERARNYTMTSIERGYALYQAVNYLVKNNIEGDIVECGVWKGGSCMIAALTLLSAGVKDRNIYLYDTFDGMPKPSENDVIAWNNKSVVERWESDQRGESDNFSSWAIGLDVVKQNLLEIGYPKEKIFFIKGLVEETLMVTTAQKIALLRLDTDWYQSTRFELEILYPKLSSGGVLIIDDYGHFKGAKKAVDEYFFSSHQTILLNRIDYTGRIGVKI